ncbi:MAG: PVC-type heme-binding CxxCH protein, partial [Planctomyces sp.]
DTVQKLLPHSFYSEKLQQDFPGPKTPEEALQTFTTKPDLKIVLAASEPLIRDPVAFDWDVNGRLWVVEMGDYPLGEATSGRVQILEDLNKDGVYDKATTFLDGLGFPNGIQCWRNGVIITMAPDVFYAEDTDGDGDADVRQTLYGGFVEGNQQHRVNGLRWGMDGWLYLANGDSGGDIAGTGEIPPQQASGRVSALRDGATSDVQSPASSSNAVAISSAEPIALRGRDLRINPDTNALEAMSGQTQFGRERDDFSHWFGNNNSDPIYQYVLEDHYLRRNPHAGISGTRARVSSIPGAAPVYPTSRTLARFNEFAYSNKFTSACGTMIYRDSFLGDQYYGNAFTSEPVHNLVSRLVMTRDGYGFKGDRATDEQQSEFLSSSDNWFRPTMIRTGPDGALWIADMYRAVIEHPEWIPPEYQRKMNLYAGNDKGRIYRIVPAAGCCDDKTSEPRTTPQAGTPEKTGTPKENVEQQSRAAGGDYFQHSWNEIPIADLMARLKSPNGWWRDTAQRILHHRRSEAVRDETYQTFLNQIANSSDSPAVTVQSLATAALISDFNGTRMALKTALSHPSPEVRTAAVQLMEPALKSTPADAVTDLGPLVDDSDPGVRLQMMLSLGECPGSTAAALLGRMLKQNSDDATIRNAGLTSLTKENIEGVLNEALNAPADQLNEELIGRLLAQASAMGQGELVVQPLTKLMASISNDSSAARFDRIAAALRDIMKTPQAAV